MLWLGQLLPLRRGGIGAVPERAQLQPLLELGQARERRLAAGGGELGCGVWSLNSALGSLIKRPLLIPCRIFSEYGASGHARVAGGLHVDMK